MPAGTVSLKAALPVALTARMLLSSEPAGPSLFLPFEQGVGAAAFSRGFDVFIVFDAVRPLDLSTVQDDPFARQSSIQLLPEATMLRLRAQKPDQIRVRRLPAGWLVQDGGEEGPHGRAIEVVSKSAMTTFPVSHPGGVVVVPDPETGGNLLVGTVLDGEDAVQQTRHQSLATLDKTILGVVVDPLSDRLELRPASSGFFLSGAAADSVAAISGDVSHQAPNRIMSLTPGAVEVLERRFKDARAAAAALPAAERFQPRLRAAEDALALGDAVQASTIAQVAMADDPRSAESVHARLVASAAGLLDHHTGADLLDDPSIIAQSEMGFWRGIKLGEQNPASVEAARLFAANMALLQSYPAPLRARLMPRVAETLARAGTEPQAALIDRLPAEPSLEFARAVLAERRGRSAAALALLDHLSSARDVRLAAKAVEEASDIRQKSPTANPGALADHLEAHLLDARIAGLEVPSRFRLADLRMQAGQWQKAVDLLRETAQLYPEQQSKARRQIGEVLRRMISDPAKSGGGHAIEQAAIIEASADMLPPGADGTRASLFLAARLTDLDLPERAAPIVQQMMRAAEAGPDRAELGLALASLRLQQNDLEGVQAALRESDPGNLAPDRQAPRQIVLARAFEAQGRLDQALAAVQSLQSDAALDLRSELLARHGDWSAAADTLLSLAQRQLPASGKLDADGQEMLLRLATVVSRTKNKNEMDKVRRFGAERFRDQDKAAMFQLLTSDPAADSAEQATTPPDLAALRRTAGVFNAASH